MTASDERLGKAPVAYNLWLQSLCVRGKGNTLRLGAVLEKRPAGTRSKAPTSAACLCGSEAFERVIVQRKPGPPIVPYVVACTGCRAEA